jgi:hypothetical protein
VLTHSDANEVTDRAVREAVFRWTGTAPGLLPYTRDPAACSALLSLMERLHRRGQLAEAVVNGTEAFLYLCARPDGQTFAQGLGSTPALAICEAFLSCRENEPPTETAAASTPIAPLFHAVGYAPQHAAEPAAALQCVNCGWEGPTPAPDPTRCPSCRRNFLRPSPRRTR